MPRTKQSITIVETSSLNITVSELTQGQNCLEVNISLYIGTFWKFVFYQCLKFPSAICWWNYLLMIKSHHIALPNLCMDEVCIVRKWFAIKFFHQSPESRERQTLKSVFASTSESTSHLEWRSFVWKQIWHLVFKEQQQNSRLSSLVHDRDAKMKLCWL